MIGIFKDYSTIYLWVVMVFTMMAFCLPILLFPLSWAKRLGWNIPGDDHLTLYFGRCLGAFILVFEYAVLCAILDESIKPFVFDLALGVTFLMTAVHVYGAVKKIQPIIETIEIGFYALLFLLTILFYPVSP